MSSETSTSSIFVLLTLFYSASAGSDQIVLFGVRNLPLEDLLRAVAPFSLLLKKRRGGMMAASLLILVIAYLHFAHGLLEYVVYPANKKDFSACSRVYDALVKMFGAGQVQVYKSQYRRSTEFWFIQALEVREAAVLQIPGVRIFRHMFGMVKMTESRWTRLWKMWWSFRTVEKVPQMIPLSQPPMAQDRTGRVRNLSCLFEDNGTRLWI